MAKIFNTTQPEKTQNKVLPREVPTIAPTRVPVTLTPPKVPETVTLPSVMPPRSPMITQDNPSEESRHMDAVKHKNKHPLKHRYPTRITQLSQEINQVESAAPAATRHKHWLMNIHEQVKSTPQVIKTFLKDNACELAKKMTQNEYLTQMANVIIDDDIGKELNYRQLSKHPKHQNIRK